MNYTFYSISEFLLLVIEVSGLLGLFWESKYASWKEVDLCLNIINNNNVHYGLNSKYLNCTPGILIIFSACNIQSYIGYFLKFYRFTVNWWPIWVVFGSSNSSKVTLYYDRSETIIMVNERPSLIPDDSSSFWYFVNFVLGSFYIVFR